MYRHVLLLHSKYHVRAATEIHGSKQITRTPCNPLHARATHARKVETTPYPRATQPPPQRKRSSGRRSGRAACDPLCLPLVLLCCRNSKCRASGRRRNRTSSLETALKQQTVPEIIGVASRLHSTLYVQYLGDEDVDAGVLVVPAELVDGLAGAERHLVPLDVLPPARRLVQPRRRSQQLILVPVEVAVAGAHIASCRLLLSCFFHVRTRLVLAVRRRQSTVLLTAMARSRRRRRSPGGTGPPCTRCRECPCPRAAPSTSGP